MSAAVQHSAVVCIGQAGAAVGRLGYAKGGNRESATFSYDPRWLESTGRFSISPDLALIEGHQYRKAPFKGRSGSVFHGAIADTEPDGWGCRVIARDHARRRKALLQRGEPAPSAALTDWDYLVGVDDFSRVGALRLKDAQGNFLRCVEEGGRVTPPLLELAHLLNASQAVEHGTETESDLRYLRGAGTSLGGLRPKCTLIDDGGHLAIGKFASVTDTRSVTRGEVLALHLAELSGIDAAQARIVSAQGSPVAVVRRFDRTIGGARIPYLSAASLLQAGRDEDRAYTEIAQRIVAVGAFPERDLPELWRRVAFNLLITNVDDHLHNHGFLHVGHGQWRLAPAFDLNPFPDKDRELKTWLTEDTGPVSSIDEVLRVASAFRLRPEQARHILAQVVLAIQNWRGVALSAPVCMEPHDLSDFAPAFEHAQMQKAAELLSR